jgi:hypothetical protein
VFTISREGAAFGARLASRNQARLLPRKFFDFGQPTTIHGSVENCPVGTRPWVDNWGNQVCRVF